MNKKYVVRLTSEERSTLQRLVSVGKAAARKILHGRILLQADQGPGGPGWKDEELAEGLSAHPRTIANVRQRFVELGLEAALNRKKQDHPSRAPKFDGHATCFLASGFEKAILLDFNYKVEPLPGKFPFPGMGPFSLLKESLSNHWGKMMFRWVYWNLMMKGLDLPMEPQMNLAGKIRQAA